MKHPTSRQLHAYWDRLRGTRAAPERGEIEPGQIRNLLADSLILEIEPGQGRSLGRGLGHAGVRLAGTRLCALFGRELRGTPFPSLWGDAPGDAAAHESWGLVETVATETVGLVAGLRGYTGRGETIDLELLLLPLRHRGRTQARMLGALAPHCVPAWLGLHPVERLETTASRMLGTAPAAGGTMPVGAPMPAAWPASWPAPANDRDPVRRGHLLIHRGGRA